MTSGEAAEHGDSIVFQHLVEHGLDTDGRAIGLLELGATIGKLTKDDAITAVEDTIHLQDTHLTIDVVHRLLDFLDEEYQVLALGGIGL